MINMRALSSRSVGRSLATLALATMAGSASAGAKIAVDDTHWVSVGAGLRASFNMVEDAAPSGDDYSKDFAINNMRLYIAGQVHKNIKFTFNTDCLNCGGGGDGGELFVLDAIAQFEFMPAFNIWAGRMLVPADRIEQLCRPPTRTTIDDALREIGYAYITVDIRGFRSGSMNEVIAFGKTVNRHGRPAQR